MDLLTLAASIGGSGLAVGAIGYLLKVAAERSLEVRLSKLRRENEAQIEEQFRRQACLWDRQFEAARSLLSLIYRLRNTFRELSLVLSSGDEAKVKEAAGILYRLNAYGDAVSEILYEERAVLPKSLFREAHEMKHSLAALRNLSRRYLSRKPTSKERRRLEEEIQDLYKIIDAIYTMVTDIVHESLGVADIEAAPSNHFAGPVAAARHRSAQ